MRVGEEFYHFFHAMFESGGHKTYAAGVYTFAAAPPFAIRRVAPIPVLLAETNARRQAVVFPCGALLRDDRWVISYGYHDQECRVAVIAAADIERLLRPA